MCMQSTGAEALLFQLTQAHQTTSPPSSDNCSYSCSQSSAVAAGTFPTLLPPTWQVQHLCPAFHTVTFPVAYWSWVHSWEAGLLSCCAYSVFYRQLCTGQTQWSLKVFEMHLYHSHRSKYVSPSHTAEQKYMSYLRKIYTIFTVLYLDSFIWHWLISCSFMGMWALACTADLLILK